MKRMLMWAVSGLGIVAVIGYSITSTRVGSAASPSVAPAMVASDVVAAGPGRVEAVSEEIRVAAQLGGRLERVLVEEGDAVVAGQPLAILEHADYTARAASADAEVRLRDAEARRVRNGAREQERRDAAAAEREADAVLANTRADVERRRGLFAQRVISREEMEHADEQLNVAAARLDSARERRSLVDAAAREEDQTRADAALALARAQLVEARAMLEKTVVRAPISGTVLRKHRKAGETVSTQFDSPIVTMADRSTLRVRVDVDEMDVAKVRVGQCAYVTADAYGDRRFIGRVVRVSQLLGKKNVRTDEPTERVDTKILETLIDLDPRPELPLGLRVQAFIQRGTRTGNHCAG
jgi:HlyD family secretion protein